MFAGAVTTFTVLPLLQDPPWGRSILSTDSATWGGMAGPGGSGCAVRQVPRGLHTPHSGWCDLGWRLRLRVSWERPPLSTANRIYRYDWRTSRFSCYRMRTAWWKRHGYTTPLDLEIWKIYLFYTKHTNNSGCIKTDFANLDLSKMQIIKKPSLSTNPTG